MFRLLVVLCGAWAVLAWLFLAYLACLMLVLGVRMAGLMAWLFLAYLLTCLMVAISGRDGE